MAQALRALIKFYQTGETADRVAYDIAWVNDKASPVDTINGFIEVYLDARGVKGALGRPGLLREPGEDRGDQKLGERCAVVRGPHAVGPEVPQAKASRASPPTPSTSSSRPATPGRSRRSASTCRTTRRSARQHGSKSVSLSNVNEAYDKSTLPALRSEFAWTPEEAERAAKWGALAGELTTNMHEVIGHASGQGRRAPRTASRRTSSKEQFSALEEGRADLVGALLSCPTRSSPRLGLMPARRSGRDRPRRVRRLRPQRPGPAPPRPAGHADRRRPHAQPSDDRPLADGEHQGDRACARATARPTTW